MNQVDNTTAEIAEGVNRQANPVIPIREALKQYIEDFERSLNDQQEIAVRLAAFGGEVIFHAERIGISAPNIITFYGSTEHGEKVQRIQHVSQLSFLLKAVKKLAPTPNRIGFI
jgi:hypothetical protein